MSDLNVMNFACHSNFDFQRIRPLDFNYLLQGANRIEPFADSRMLPPPLVLRSLSQTPRFNPYPTSLIVDFLQAQLTVADWLC